MRADVVVVKAVLVTSLAILAAPACDYRAPIGLDLAVVAIAPANGAGFGRAGAAHPALRWRAGHEATRFHVQMDDSCTGPASCDFPSPEVDERSLSATSFVPASELPYQSAAPVGRRYFWRVRACTDETCGDWSTVRYVIAGRTSGALNTDLNGDGYAEMVIAAPTSSAVVNHGGQVFVWRGGSPLTAAQFSGPGPIVLGSGEINDGLGATVAMVGDVNGDGFGDLLVRTIGNESDVSRLPTPRVLLYLGGETLRADPDVIITGGIVNDENMAAAGIGDVNGDGYDDFAFGGATVAADRTAAFPSWVQIHLGGPTLTGRPHLTVFGTSSPDFFGSSVAGAGDVNGDGYPDLVVAGHQEPGNRAQIYFGGHAMDDVADVTLAPPADAPLYYGFSVAIPGDVNGDGYDDVVVSAPGSDAYPGTPGRAYLYFGGQTIGPGPDVTFASTVEAEWFAKIVAPAGDIDADGFADIAMVTQGVQGLQGVPIAPGRKVTTTRRLDLFRGGPTVDTTADVTIYAGAANGSARGFAATDLDGDTRPDMVIGRWATQDASMGEVMIHPGQDGYQGAAIGIASFSAGEHFGAKIAR